MIKTSEPENDVIAITAYPLSKSFVDQLKERFGDNFNVVSLARLRQGGILRLVSNLRGIKSRVVILPVEDEESEGLLHILMIVIWLTRGGEKIIAYRDGESQHFAGKQVYSTLVRLTLGSFMSGLTAAWCFIELLWLMSAPKKQIPPSPMRHVLYVKTNQWFGFKAGGSIGHIAGVINGMVEQCRDVVVCAAQKPLMVDEAVSVKPLPPLRAYGLPLELNNYRFQRQCSSKIIKQGYAQTSDVVYQRLTLADYVGVKLARRYNLPLIVEYNGSEVWVSMNWGAGLKFKKLAEMAEAAMLRHADLVVTVSEPLKRDLVLRGVAKEKIVMYPNCIDPRIFDPARFDASQIKACKREYGIPEGKLVVMFIGTFGQWHGAEVLAQAIKELHGQFSTDKDFDCLHFTFVGDGLTLPDVKKELQPSPAPYPVSYTGMVPQDKAPLILSCADIFVSPHVPNRDGSAFFGSPTKLFEYMAMERPIIASDLDQIGDVLQGITLEELRTPQIDFEKTEKTAVLVEPGDSHHLASAIMGLAKNRELGRRLARNARATALRRFTWSAHVAEIFSVARQSSLLADASD